MVRLLISLLKLFIVGAVWKSLVGVSVIAAPAPSLAHTFEIGRSDFLLDGKPFQIRCGEIHFARVPREYWKQRLQLCKAMGLNAVCAYLFWNFHEFDQGQFRWEDQADAAEFCRLAQAEGLWVILRPGPYSCAEWDMGGLPWWLLKNEKIEMRSQDPTFLGACNAWIKEVGRVLGPLQVSKGGPILMVQVENEYGFYGKDSIYMGKLRQMLLDAGFSVPLFDCNPANVMANGLRKDLFHVANFGKDPAGQFEKLRKIQPEGPLMCGEFYPGWFDCFGVPHHLGNTQAYLHDLEYMLGRHASFSIYMAHGGTTFGLWSGTDRPFKPDTASYDYDAPISEAGWIGDKFWLTRDLFRKYLQPGETIPEPGPANPVISVPHFELIETAAVFDNLPAQTIYDPTPRNMESYNQGHGCILYRTTLSVGPAASVEIERVADFAWVYVDGKLEGVMDRRNHTVRVPLPARTAPARLDILVESMGHVNFGREIHDRKGLQAPVFLKIPGQPSSELVGWKVFPLRLDAPQLAGLKWKTGKAAGAAFWRGNFVVSQVGDTFLDTSSLGKGVLWVNGHCLGRFWNIGPTQTLYLPGPWIKQGRNEVVVFDLAGPVTPTLEGLERPVLDRLRPDLDFAQNPTAKNRLALDGVSPVYSGIFAAGSEMQEVRLPHAMEGRQFCLESMSAYDGKPYAAISELDIFDTNGNSFPHAAWTIAYVDSQEKAKEDGSALNAIDGQTANYWNSAWSTGKSGHPHQIVIDLGASVKVGGFRYTPRAGAGNNVPGRIKEYRIFIGKELVRPAQ